MKLNEDVKITQEKRREVLEGTRGQEGEKELEKQDLIKGMK